MDWLRLFYEQWGAPYPRFSLAIMFLVGGLFLAITWHTIGKSYHDTEVQKRVALNRLDKTAFAKLTNQELKKEVSDFLSLLRGFNEGVYRAQPKQDRDAEMKEYYAAKTDEDRGEIATRHTNAYQKEYERWRTEMVLEYERNFRAKALVLRDELMRRIPESVAGKRYTIIYENLAGPSPLADIATDLEGLSMLLSD
jgi:hypothetical protein